jgi:hypothetical protein
VFQRNTRLLGARLGGPQEGPGGPSPGGPLDINIAREESFLGKGLLGCVLAPALFRIPERGFSSRIFACAGPRRGQETRKPLSFAASLLRRFAAPPASIRDHQGSQ